MCRLLQAGGWTLLTAVNLMLFSLLHNPCSTTIYTIYKETGSRKWTVVAALLPLAMGFAVTFLVAQVWRLVGGRIKDQTMKSGDTQQFAQRGAAGARGLWPSRSLPRSPTIWRNAPSTP